MVKPVALLLISSGFAFAQDPGLARDFYAHGMLDRALECYIEILHNPRTASADRAEALYFMGQIAFDQNAYSTAIDDWQRLIRQFPESTLAAELKGRLVQLREVSGEAAEGIAGSPVARAYLKNGDFWANGEKRFTIDGASLSPVELAITWYDRVIQEYPGTDAAQIAYQRKLFALLGWRDSGQAGEAYGAQANYEYYMPQVVKTFAAFESAFPRSTHIQGFRYQIAQAYCAHKDWENARTWLNRIIEAGSGQPSFYSEAAKARLQRLEN